MKTQTCPTFHCADDSTPSTVSTARTFSRWPNKKVVWSEKEGFDPYRLASKQRSCSRSAKKRTQDLQTLLRDKGLEFESAELYQSFGSL